MGDPRDLEILYQDDYLVAINKPHGLLVHRSRIAKDVSEFALQSVRNQIGMRVHLIHRLDRKTSGVLLFGLNPETTRQIQQQFINGEIIKTYVAVVRGFFPDSTIVNYPLTNDRGKLQEAITEFESLEQTEITIAHGKWKTSRYSLIKAIPKTGRQHQIRKHLSHINHPIIGDRPHGCNKQNRLFKENWGMTSMLLHARSLQLLHPITSQPIRITASLSADFNHMIEQLSFNQESVVKC